MSINLSYPKILDLFRHHVVGKRSESAAFLIWYLQNYYRLDEAEAVEFVCDYHGDRGVDGIFVNDDDQTVTIFQSQILQRAGKTVGDAGLRELAGTMTQFKNPNTVKDLIRTTGESMLAGLVERLDVATLVSTYKVRGEYLSNADIDANGENFLLSNPEIAFVGKDKLQRTYISTERDAPIHAKATFDIAGFDVVEYIVDENTKAIIAPVKATQLVSLDGISNQSLFIHNVRGPLGKTRVNRDIVESIRDTSYHKLFPLFHNGITVIAGTLEQTKGRLSIGDYFVVNGCQSLTALHGNKKELTDDLRILTKFILLDPTSQLAAQVTQFSNNQNGVKARDFMANTDVQIRLQNEFDSLYENQYCFEIKRGEKLEAGEIISNEDAGLYLMAFDLKEPWGTHRKYQVFDERHAELFARPEVTADRIVLCRTIKEAIDIAATAIDDQLLGKYTLTKYMLMYIVRELMEHDEFGKAVLKKPAIAVRNASDRKRFKECILKLLKDSIVDLNAEVAEWGVGFDYRYKLRDKEWVSGVSKTILTDHIKMVQRRKIPSLKDDWENSNENKH